MAEAPTFSGFSSGDSAQTFAKVIAQIKADMAAIEASAKNIEGSLSKASHANISGGAGGTGSAKPAFGDSSLGKITTQLGGWSGVGHALTFGAGAAMGGMGIGGSQGAIAGGIAFSALPDLVLRPERALDREAAQFGVAQATGDFGTFNRMLSTAKNSFNVQNQEAFQNTLVYGTQRAGMVGLNGGGTVGERKAASQIGGFNTMAAMAGIDQTAVPGMMQSSLSAQNYYASMAAGIMTRNPVTGETIGIEGQVNQGWKTAGLRGTQQQMLDQIDINYGEGSTGIAQLREQYGGNEDMVQTYIEGLRIRARQGGKALKENQVQDQAKDIGEAGGLGTKKTQGMESTRGLESAKMDMTTEYLEDATTGIRIAAEEITKAVKYLTDLEGPLRTIVGAYTTMANGMDVAKTEVPGALKGITDFLSGIPGLLLQAFGLKSLMGGSGGGGGIAGQIGRFVARQAVMAVVKHPVIAALAATLIAAKIWGRTGEETVDSWESGASKPSTYLTGDTGTSTASTAVTPGASAASTSSSAPSGYTGGYAKGDWFVESDQDARIHYGEMVVPNRIANAVREELSVGKTGGGRATSRGGGATVNIYLTIQRATDQEAMQFAGRVKRIIENDRELLAIGSGRLSSG